MGNNKLSKKNLTLNKINETNLLIFNCFCEKKSSGTYIKRDVFLKKFIIGQQDIPVVMRKVILRARNTNKCSKKTCNICSDVIRYIYDRTYVLKCFLQGWFIIYGSQDLAANVGYG